MLEKEVVKRIKTWCKANDFFFLKHNGSAFAQMGIPDLILCYCGQFIAIEAKATGKEPTEAQLLKLHEIRDHYGYAAWFDDPQDAIQWLKDIKNTIDREWSSQRTKEKLP